MARILNFDENGIYIIGADVYNVSENYEVKENQYLAKDNENISFNIIKLKDGELVEGKTEPDEPIEKPIEITYEDLLKQHILDLEFMLLIK